MAAQCDRDGEDGPLCYKQMGAHYPRHLEPADSRGLTRCPYLLLFPEWIETYLNKAEVKKELGAAPDTTFASCNMQINQAFTFNGDVAHNTAALIPELLEAGIRVLIYAGGTSRRHRLIKLAPKTADDDVVCHQTTTPYATTSATCSGLVRFLRPRYPTSTDIFAVNSCAAVEWPEGVQPRQGVQLHDLVGHPRRHDSLRRRRRGPLHLPARLRRRSHGQVGALAMHGCDCAVR